MKRFWSQRILESVQTEIDVICWTNENTKLPIDRDKAGNRRASSFENLEDNKRVHTGWQTGQPGSLSASACKESINHAY